MQDLVLLDLVRTLPKLEKDKRFKGEHSKRHGASLDRFQALNLTFQDKMNNIWRDSRSKNMKITFNLLHNFIFVTFDVGWL